MNYTYAYVSPILTEQDKLLLTDIMRKVQKQTKKKPATVKFTNTAKYTTKQDIIYITNIGIEIIQLLNNLRFLVIQRIANTWDILP